MSNQWGHGDPIGSMMNSRGGGEDPRKRDLQNRQIIAESAVARLLESKSKAEQAQVSDYKIDAGDAMIVRTHYRKTAWFDGIKVLLMAIAGVTAFGLFVGKWIMFVPFAVVGIAFLFSPQFFFWRLARDNVAGEGIYNFIRGSLFSKRIDFLLLFGFFASPMSIISWWFMRENNVFFDFVNRILVQTPQEIWGYYNVNHVSFLIAFFSSIVVFFLHTAQGGK